MSRSRRKTPITGHAVCSSERQDKKLWHQRWRSHERTALSGASPEQLHDHLTVLEKQVSNVWAMGKDGRSYWSKARQLERAESGSNRIGRTTPERAALKKRLLRRLLGK